MTGVLVANVQDNKCTVASVRDDKYSNKITKKLGVTFTNDNGSLLCHKSDKYVAQRFMVTMSCTMHKH